MKTLLFLNALAGIVLLFSCKEKNLKVPASDYMTLPTTNNMVYNNIGKLTPKVKTATINATSGGSLYSSSGARFIFPAHAFYTMDGNAVTGPVTIDVSESIMEQHMTVARTLNLHTGEILVPGIFFTLKAKQEKELLKVTHYVRYQAYWRQYSIIATICDR